MDLDDFRYKYIDKNLLTSEDVESIHKCSDVLDRVLFIVETITLGREAMLTFVDCLYQGGYIDTAEGLLVKNRPTLNQGSIILSMENAYIYTMTNKGK